MVQVEIKRVEVSYGALIAAKDISFSVSEGEYICLIGSNGSGKSSLLKAIIGLVPVDHGSIKLNIEKKDIAYLSQKQETERDFPATVREVVMTGTQKSDRIFSNYNKQDYIYAENTMKLLNILSIAERRIGELSGGQQKRVFLARALCRQPRMLILDEPCAGLDPTITTEFYEILNRLNNINGLTILMATHDVKQVEVFASRIIVMNNTVEFDGSPGDFKSFGQKGEI